MSPLDDTPRFSVSTKDVKVVRVEVQTVDVPQDYTRVELVMDGETYELQPDQAQRLGQLLNRAAGGPS